MSMSMMERVAGAARALAENGKPEEGRSFRGFRQQTEQMTDRLIAAMFPPYAAASRSRESALLEAAEAGSYTELILRAVGIGLLAELGASFCRELGEHALADGVLFFGRAEILVLSLPLLDRLVDLAEEMLKW